jgi:hypothetical protein
VNYWTHNTGSQTQQSWAADANVIWLSDVSKSSKWLRDLVGGFLTLAGAGLVSWQAVLAYYLIIGRIQVGEEHPSFAVIAIVFIIGIFLIFAGYTFSKPSRPKPKIDTNNSKPQP